MTKTHKIYMPFNWKRTKKLTFTFILINTALLFLILNSRGVFLDNVQIKTQLKGYFAKHELQSTINNSAWLPKLSFLVLQLDTKSSKRPTRIQWKNLSEDFSGFTFDNYWMHYETESKRVLIPYIILPGKSMSVSVNYEEVALSTLQLPQLLLEEGQQEHLQNYKIEMDTRYKKVHILPSLPNSPPSQNERPSRHIEISVTTGQPAPKLSWEYIQTLKTIEFMG